LLSAGTRKNRRIELGQRSRTRIREVASKLIAERGCAGTSIGAIASGSGLPASSLYWHFGSKQGLLAAVAAEGASRWLDLIPDWENLTGPSHKRLDRMLGEMARQMKERPDLIRLQLALYIERSNIDPASASIIRAVRRQAIAKLRPAMEALVESVGGTPTRFVLNELSNFALSFANGCFVDHQIDSAATPLRRRFDQLKLALIGVARDIISRLEKNGQGDLQ
jgi:AcrR family transcriptional regulator